MPTLQDERSTTPVTTHDVVVRVVGDGGSGGPRRRSWGGVRTLAILGALGAIAVAVVVLANAIGGLHVSLFSTNNVDRSAPVVLKQLRDVSSYTAATGEFESTVDIEKDVSVLPSFLAGERAIFVGVGSVDANVDFSQLSEDAVTVQDGNVTVTLPVPTLTKPSIDPARSHVANRDRGLVNRIAGVFEDNPTSERALYLKARERIAKAAAGSELQARAEENTEAMLRALLGKLGFQQVNVQFAAPEL